MTFASRTEFRNACVRAHSGMYTTRGYINDKFPPHFLAFLFFLILTLRCYRRSSSLVTVRSCLHSTALQDLIANLPFNSLCWPFPKGPRASFDWFGLVRSGGRVGLSIFDFTLFYGLEFYSVPCLLIWLSLKIESEWKVTALKKKLA